MRIQMLKRAIAFNNVLTIMNGFVFGLLIQFSPLHPKKGKPKRVSLIASVALLFVLVFVLIAVIR